MLYQMTISETEKKYLRDALKKSLNDTDSDTEYSFLSHLDERIKDMPSYHPGESLR